jgi:putative ABC transport system permease protein
MTAVVRKLIRDLRRRKLQTAIIAFVVMLSSAAGTMALSLLVETNAPFDHAFAAQQGAHLILFFDPSRVSHIQIAATATAPDVASAAGPWEQVDPNLQASSSSLGNTSLLGNTTLIGRGDPSGPVDRLSLLSGRWMSAPNEVVLERHFASDTSLQVGDTLTAMDAAGQPRLTVVGVFVSIAREQGWVLPGEISRLVPITQAAASGSKRPVEAPSPVQWVMAYRLHAASSNRDVLAAEAHITQLLPSGAVVGESNWLDLKQSAELLSNVMVPFLLAFSGIALLASALIIANVVAGTVIAGYREIGIMKAIGFTPAQIGSLLVAGTCLPAIVGSAFGLIIGTLGSQPFLQDTANALGVPLPFSWSPDIAATVLAGVLVITALAAALPAGRAAQLSAVAAITAGSAPASSKPSRLGAALGQLPLPRALTLGVAESFAQPLRSSTTLIAIVFGVATVTFATGLHGSLLLVKESISRTDAVPVEVQSLNSGGSLPATASPNVESILRESRDTANVVAEAQSDIHVTGIAKEVILEGFRGPSSTLGYALIQGRWFSGADEVVVESAFLDDTQHRIGDIFSAAGQGGSHRLRIVGTYVNNRGGGYRLLADWITLVQLDPPAAPMWWEVQTTPGADVAAYVDSFTPTLQAAGYGIDARAGRGIDDSFFLLNLVIVALAAVLTLIAVSGVFNTVLLGTRERLRESAILKALGMSPRGLIVMIITSVASLGLLGGLLGVPAGLAVHRAILGQMASIAGTDIPASFYAALTASWLPILAASGLAVAILGAALPALWVARTRVADVLHSE